jgi:hypothetical protein
VSLLPDFCTPRHQHGPAILGIFLSALVITAATWPLPECSEAKQLELPAADLAALLGGLDLRTAKRRRWYSRES